MTGQTLSFIGQRLRSAAIEMPEFNNIKRILKYRLSIGLDISEGPMYFHTRWWMLYDKSPDIPHYLKPNGDFKIASSASLVLPVRPIITFESAEYAINGCKMEYKVGEEMLVGDYLFEIVAQLDNKWVALCETAIGYSDFHGINKCLQDWKDTLIYRGTTIPASKALRKDDISFDVKNVKPLDVTSAYNIPLGRLPDASFWLYGRKTEFSGYSVDISGSIKETGIGTVMNVFPCITSTPKCPLLTGDKVCFALNGYIFRILSDHTAICLNTIGVSCYSTGIQEVTTEENEEHYYEDSEICELTQKWFKMLNK